jgi:hypothetical protein
MAMVMTVQDVVPSLRDDLQLPSLSYIQNSEVVVLTAPQTNPDLRIDDMAAQARKSMAGGMALPRPQERHP